MSVKPPLLKRLEDDMTELDTADRDVAALETAPTCYVEGSGVRFAYRQLGPATGTPLVLLQHFSGTIDAWCPVVSAHRLTPTKVQDLHEPPPSSS